MRMNSSVVVLTKVGRCGLSSRGFTFQPRVPASHSVHRRVFPGERRSPPLRSWGVVGRWPGSSGRGNLAATAALRRSARTAVLPTPPATPTSSRRGGGRPSNSLSTAGDDDALEAGGDAGDPVSDICSVGGADMPSRCLQSEKLNRVPFAPFHSGRRIQAGRRQRTARSSPVPAADRAPSHPDNPARDFAPCRTLRRPLIARAAQKLIRPAARRDTAVGRPDDNHNRRPRKLPFWQHDRSMCPAMWTATSGSRRRAAAFATTRERAAILPSRPVCRERRGRSGFASTRRDRRRRILAECCGRELRHDAAPSR